jgi:hypothetical protein
MVRDEFSQRRKKSSRTQIKMLILCEIGVKLV